MLVDYHMHVMTDLYGKSKPEEYIEVAKERGIDEIGFSDHFHVNVKYDTTGVLKYSMRYEDLPKYVKMVQELKRTAGIPLKLGIEMDYVPNLEDKIKKIIDSYPFDYIIGSIHFVNNFGFDNPKEISEYKKWEIFKLYQLYFDLIQKLAKSGLFNIIGHVDIIKIFGFKPRKDTTDILKDTIEIFKKNNVCIEVNTSGLNKPCKEIYPSEKFLKLCFASGVLITLGSDAHNPRNVGQYFDKAISLIKKVGYEKISIFENRKMKLVEISD